MLIYKGNGCSIMRIYKGGGYSMPKQLQTCGFRRLDRDVLRSDAAGWIALVARAAASKGLATVYRHSLAVSTVKEAGEDAQRTLHMHMHRKDKQGLRDGRVA